ncbi:hypothetical protein OH76DRAFT_297976 [Lentinus brumalis]|uniref:Uncharacterized protein n=1 Tax=Lentinus brumalis TaxID=2498619 RepID=A0A371DG14_9APHY|nr:hypothetical protein OH76DRAFT_297976 [Polyporus brumalis]
MRASRHGVAMGSRRLRIRRCAALQCIAALVLLDRAARKTRIDHASAVADEAPPPLRRRTRLKMGEVLFSQSFFNLLVGIRPAVDGPLYEMYQTLFTFVAFAVIYARLNPFRCQNKAIVQYLSKVPSLRRAER